MRVVRQSAQTLGAHLLVFAQGLLLTPIVIKVSGIEVYGGYILALSYIGIIFGISSLGVGISAKRWLPSHCDPVERAALFYPQFYFQLAMVLVLSTLSMLAYVVGRGMGWFSLAGFSVWLIPSYLVAYVFYSQATDYFRYTHRIGAFNIATVSQPYLFILLSLLGYFFAGILNPGSLFLAVTIASLLVGAPQLWRLHHEIGLNFCFPTSTELSAEIKLGFPLVLSYLVDVILAGGDRYIIAAMLSVRHVGAYVPAYTLGSLVIVLPKVFGVVLPPLLSRCVDANDTVGARRTMSGASRIFLLVSIPFVAGSLVLGEQILRLYTNEEVSSAAWPVIPLVALGSIFYGLILINANLLFVRLKTGALFRINAVAAGLNIVLNIVLLNVVADVTMAAVATLVSYLVSYVWLKHHMSSDAVAARIDLGWLCRVIGASALMGGVIFMSLKVMPGAGIASIGIGMLSGCIAYGLTLFILRIADAEFGMIRQLALRS